MNTLVLLMLKVYSILFLLLSSFQTKGYISANTHFTFEELLIINDDGNNPSDEKNLNTSFPSREPCKNEEDDSYKFASVSSLHTYIHHPPIQAVNLKLSAGIIQNRLQLIFPHHFFW